MRDWPSSGGAKIKRAKEHITDFDHASHTFLDTHLYTAISQFDPKSREISFVVDKAPPIDPRLECIAADAIHNLHVSLDLLWHHVWARGGTAGHKGKRTGEYFPCLETTDELKPRYKSVKERAAKDAVNIILATKGDQSRNKLLQALHGLDIRDKHEVLVLAAASYKKIIMKAPPDVALDGKTGLQFVGEIGSGFLFLEKGTKLPLVVRLETDAGPVMDMDCELTADIAFGKGEILEGKSVIETLQELAQLVDGIANAFLTAGLLK